MDFEKFNSNLKWILDYEFKMIVDKAEFFTKDEWDRKRLLEEIERIRKRLCDTVEDRILDLKADYNQEQTNKQHSEITPTSEKIAEEEREASYILNSCNHKLDRIKTLTATTKQQMEFISDNLEQLNKTESALRLEYNMTSNVWDVGDTKDDTLGNQEAQPLIQQGYDPLVDTQDVEDI